MGWGNKRKGGSEGRRKKWIPGGKERKKQNDRVNCYNCQNNRKTLLKIPPIQAPPTGKTSHDYSQIYFPSAVIRHHGPATCKRKCFICLTVSEGPWLPREGTSRAHILIHNRKAERGTGNGFWNLQVHTQCHTYCTKATPPNPNCSNNGGLHI